jgi:hypothetical protein
MHGEDFMLSGDTNILKKKYLPKIWQTTIITQRSKIKTTNSIF